MSLEEKPFNDVVHGALHKDHLSIFEMLKGLVYDFEKWKQNAKSYFQALDTRIEMLEEKLRRKGNI